MKKKILISGYSGFIGTYLYNELNKKFIIYKFPLNIKKNVNKYIEEIIKYYKPDYFLYLSFVKKPKSNKDIFINQELPKIILNILETNNYNCKFIYFSTITVLFKKYKNTYISQKKICEQNIDIYENVSIIRMPLILSNDLEGDLKKLNKFVNFFSFVSLIPFRGSNLNYININTLVKTILKIINSEQKYKYYNLIGKKNIYLYEIAKSISKNKIRLYIPTDFFFKIVFSKISPALIGIDYKEEINLKKLATRNTENIYI